jgi:hypothetical protein
MSDKVEEFLDTESQDTRKRRIEFLAELVLEVLQSVSIPNTWRDVAVNAVFLYQKNRQRYLDGDVEDLLTQSINGDWWVRRSYITNPKSRAEIRDVLATGGYYIATIVGEGIYLATNPNDIKEDYSRHIGQIRTRTTRMNHRAVAIDKEKHIGLPISSIQTILADGTEDTS